MTLSETETPTAPEKGCRIVPESRLLLLTGLIGVPCAALSTVVPVSQAAMIWLILAGCVAVAVVDALAARYRLDGVRVRLPEIVRLSKNRAAEISLCVQTIPSAGRGAGVGAKNFSPLLLRVGLAMPPALVSPLTEMRLRTSPDASPATFNWPCTATRRGRYSIDAVHMERNSLLGLWAARTVRPAACEIRVYPDLSAERRRLAALFMNRGLGVHVHRQVGKGREFEKLRDYLPGDGFEDIHWKATARRNRPVTKVYQIERTQQVYVILDASRLSGRPAGASSIRAANENGNAHAAPTILERYIAGTLVLALAAERQGDRFGLLAFSDRIRHFVGAGGGKAHYGACRDQLYTLEPERVTPDYAELFTTIGTRIRRRALLLFLTHMDDPVLAESFLHHAEMVARKHLMIVVMVRPALSRRLFSGEPAVNSTELYEKLGGHLLWRDIRETEKRLARRGIGFSMPESEKLCPEIVSRYLAIKHRQVL